MNIANDPLTFRDIMVLIGMLFTGATALLGVWWRIELRIREVERKASHDMRNAEAVWTAKLALLDRDFSGYKLEATREFAAKDAVKELEHRLEDRLESLSEEVRGMPEQIVNRITQFLTLRDKTGK